MRTIKIILLLLIGIIPMIINAQHGTGIYIEGAGKLTNCVIFNGNQLGNYGSAIAISGEGALVANCLVAQHTCVADDVPTAILQLSGSSMVVNSSFIHNRNWLQIPCISGNITLINCLVWGNRKVYDGNAILPVDAASTFYCAIEGAAPYAGVGNTALSGNNTGDANSPHLINPIIDPGQDLGDYHLLAGSACIGTGNTALLPAGLTTDLDGKLRKYGNFVDMGCYQSYSPIWLSGKTVTYSGLPQGVDAAQFFDTNGNPVTQPGSTTVTYTYYQDGVSLGAGVVPTNVGTYEAVAGFSGGGGLPVGTSNRATLVINKAPLAVTASDSTAVYGFDPTQHPAGYYTYAGFVNGETATTPGVITTVPIASIDPQITSTTPVGIYADTILVGGGAAPNYDLIYNKGSLTINKAPLTATANDSTKIYNAIPFSGGSYTLSGIVDGKTQSQIINESAMVYGGTAQGAMLPGTYIITITGISSIDPNYSDPVISGTGTLIINNPPPPVITSHPQSDTLCLGDDYALSVSATGAYLNYQWRFNGQDIVGAVSAQLQLSNLRPENAGKYTVKIFNPGGFVISNEAIIGVSLPVLAIVWNDVLSVINVPANNGGYTFTSYQWYRNGLKIDGQTGGNLQLAPGSSGSYYAVLTATDGKSYQTCEQTLTVPLSSSLLKVYPNPASTQFTIEGQDIKAGDRIELLDSNGKPVKSFTAVGSQNLLEISGLKDGMYMVTVNGKAVKVIKN